MPDDPWESSGYNVWAARSLRQVERGLPSVLGGLTEPALSGLGIKGQRSGLDKPFDQIGGALDLLWVQPLFHHVDDQDGRAFGFQPDKQSDQGLRHRGAVFDQPGEGLVNPRLQGRVGVEPRPGRRAAVRRPVEVQEGAAGQGLG